MDGKGEGNIILFLKNKMFCAKITMDYKLK